MEIYFSTKKMAKWCSCDKEMRKKWGPRLAKRLQQRLMELKAADTLDDVPRVPPPRCHELSGKMKGQLSVDLVHPYRLIFIPDHDPIPHKRDGGLDWTRVTRILLVEVTNTH